MAASLFSAQWYRVSDLKPRLRAQVKVLRQRWRDQLWYVLADDATGRQHRINDAAYQFIGRCDGVRSVQQVWDAVLDALGDAAPTQDEVVDLLARLYEGELLQSERSPDVEALFQRRDERTARRRRAMINPLSFRLPLGDPSAWLTRLDPLAKRLLRPAVFWLWLVAVLVTALAAASNWDALRAHAGVHLLTPTYLALMWVCYPLVKTLHELGHALAVRRWGGEVHEVGIALLVLVPAPYVDASAASAFMSRQQRAQVSAAGIMVELALAALGLLVWLNTQPGLVQDIAFVVMFIGSVSTLLFNANPLLRFDGYYVLADVLDLPNLATRSNAYWNHLLRRHVLRVRADPPQMGAGERKWLLAYAPLSLFYRLFISLVILLWVGGKWLMIGVLLAVYLGITMLVWPLVRWMRQALAAAAPGRELARVHLGLGLLVLVPGLILFALPMPFGTVAPAVVWLPDQAYVRPEVDGFVVELPVRDGAAVRPGDLLAVLDNPDLVSARDRLASRLLGLRAEQYQLLLRDPLGAQNQAEEITRTEAELARAEERIGQLHVHAQAAGRLVMPRQADLPGSYAKQGVPLGYVLGEGDALVRAAIPVQDAYQVQHRTRAAEVRLAEMPGVELPAKVRLDVPAATRKLPSPALGDRGGGPFATDPADKDGTQALEPVFLFDLTLAGQHLERVGQRAWVRFDHGYEPVAVQGYRHLAQLFLKHFNPSE